MTNPRKGKKMIGVWLTQEEILSIKSIKDPEQLLDLGKLFNNVYQRGDWIE